MVRGRMARGHGVPRATGVLRRLVLDAIPSLGGQQVGRRCGVYRRQPFPLGGGGACLPLWQRGVNACVEQRRWNPWSKLRRGSLSVPERAGGGRRGMGRARVVRRAPRRGRPAPCRCGGLTGPLYWPSTVPPCLVAMDAGG